MESAPAAHRNLYKRLLTYHFYRDGHKPPSETSNYLNRVYGKAFLTTPAVKRLYQLFERPEFDFTRLCSLDEDVGLGLGEESEHRVSTRRKPKMVSKKNVAGSSDGCQSEDDEDSEVDDLVVKDTESAAANSDPNYSPTKTSSSAKAKSSSTSTTKKTTKIKREKKRKMPEFLGRPPLPVAASDPITVTGILPADQENISGLPQKKNIRRRQLYLHCYEANYSAAEAARYLNTVYGENFATKTSISGWYRKFKARDFTLHDKPRSGRRAAMKDADLDAYMREHPKSTVPKLCEHFKVHRKTMMRCLHRLCYRFVIDQWLKIEDKNEITDQMLCEHKLRNPEASVREIAEHFQINRAVVARRLRSMGFNIPKWPTWPKKKRDPESGEWICVAKPPKPGETFIKRKAVPKKPKVIEQMVVSGGQEMDLASTSCGNAPTGSQEIQQQLPPIQQQQIPTSDSANFNNLLQLATSSAVSSILPAVLRHKIESNTFGPQGPMAQPQPSVVTGPPTSVPGTTPTIQALSAAQPQQTNVIVGPITAGPDGPTPYIQSLPSQQQVIVGSQYPGIQGPSQSQQQGPQSQNQSQQQEPDILMQAVFDSFNPPLDNVQVQSILHPYYM